MKDSLKQGLKSMKDNWQTVTVFTQVATAYCSTWLFPYYLSFQNSKLLTNEWDNEFMKL
jgi:hypothetical protein